MKLPKIFRKVEPEVDTPVEDRPEYCGECTSFSTAGSFAPNVLGTCSKRGMMIAIKLEPKSVKCTTGVRA